ncbi:hypothetical protein KKH3_43060 [Pectobacterium actinidiae]|nr:hypothetical protein KKH3_43060 [Pectobacterium actinidiae]
MTQDGTPLSGEINPNYVLCRAYHTTLFGHATADRITTGHHPVLIQEA